MRHPVSLVFFVCVVSGCAMAISGGSSIQTEVQSEIHPEFEVPVKSLLLVVHTPGINRHAPELPKDMQSSYYSTRRGGKQDSESDKPIERFSFGSFLARQIADSLAHCLPERFEWLELSGLEIDVASKLKFKDDSAPDHVLAVNEKELLLYNDTAAKRIVIRTELWDTAAKEVVWQSSIDSKAKGYSGDFESFCSSITSHLASVLRENGILEAAEDSALTPGQV